MKRTSICLFTGFLFFFLSSSKGFSQQVVLTSSGEKVVLNYLSSLGGTISGTLTTVAGINNTGTITNTGSLINNGTLTNNGNATITGTLTLPSLLASTLIGTDGSKGVATGNLTGDITTSGFTATLTNTGVIVGTYGSSTAVPQITVDSKGRITTITTTTITAGGTTHTISETFGGGIVFYVTTDGLHGLIAETQNQSTDSDWYVAHDIISNPANHSYEGQKFIDWRLPTKYELNLMFNARSTIGGFTNNYYWSSTESDFNVTTNNRESWLQNMSSGTPFKTFSSTPFYVRAIRSF